jgi:hypothetical protein
MARRRVRYVDLVRSGGEGGLGVADLLLQRLAHEQARLRSLGLSGGRRDDRAASGLNARTAKLLRFRRLMLTRDHKAQARNIP